MSTLAPTLQAFFTDYLVRQRRASAHTVAAYRDTCKLLLTFAQASTGKAPSQLRMADVNAPLVCAFLDHLQHRRGNSVRTRNARLAAVHSLFGFAALRHPEDSAVIQRVLAIPAKRSDGRWSATSPSPRSTLCSPPSTPRHGPDGATTLS